MFLKTDGLVVRQVNYKDNDQILTVLTKEHGLMTLKARGVRSRSSRLKGACQLLAYSEFTVFENRGFHTIDEANAIQMFPELRTDIELLSLASYFAQVAEVLSQEDMPNPELLSLTLNALYALCRRLCTPELVKAAFELRAACLGGYTPQLSGCAVCGDPEPDRFDVRGGILCCASRRRGPSPASQSGFACRDSLSGLLRCKAPLFVPARGPRGEGAVRSRGNVSANPAGARLLYA